MPYLMEIGPSLKKIMKKKIHAINTLFLAFLAFFATSCTAGTENTRFEEIPAYNYSNASETATFAAGCFWCVEAAFEGLEGVMEVVSGYAGGKEKNPTYADVSSGKTGHREAVQIKFNPEVISYSELLDIFWQQFDPTDEGGSFADRGSSYTSAIFFHSPLQKLAAEASKEKLGQSGKFANPIITPILKFSSFYPAEAYHQDYYKNNPEEYKAYRKASGRDDFIAEHWPKKLEERYTKPSDAELKKKLNKLQYEVTMHEATERAFANAYNDNKEEGIYVCIVSGAPLFSSADKYESYSGWPSFTKPLDARLLEKPVDMSLGMTRVEVRSKLGKSHIGHVFFDGPAPTRLRYCMNSAAMRFVPKKDMEKEGYGEWLWAVD